LKTKRFRIIIIAIIAGIASLAAAVSALLLRGGLTGTNGPDAIPAMAPVREESTAPPPSPPPSVVRLMAVGDNLIHNTLYEQARSRARGAGYDFKFAYDGARELLGQADLAVINQETVVAGALYPPSNYPLFNSPTELGDEVYSLGFRAVSLSNNHMLDKGARGAEASLDYWDSKPGVVTSGAYRDEADFLKPRVLEVNGVTFGFAGATFGYNGLRLPSDTSMIMPLLEEEDRLKAAVETARQAADVVVVSVHWGAEYSHQVSDAQRGLARKLVSWGADIVLGTHPHVLQSMEWLDKPDGGQAFVAYSLGNFISAQDYTPRLVGGILDVSVEKDHETGAITLKEPRLRPVITQYGPGFAGVHLVLWEDYTQEMAQKHGVRRKDSGFSKASVENLLERVIPEEFLHPGNQS